MPMPTRTPGEPAAPARVPSAFSPSVPARVPTMPARDASAAPTIPARSAPTVPARTPVAPSVPGRTPVASPLPRSTSETTGAGRFTFPSEPGPVPVFTECPKNYFHDNHKFKCPILDGTEAPDDSTGSGPSSPSERVRAPSVPQTPTRVPSPAVPARTPVPSFSPSAPSRESRPPPGSAPEAAPSLPARTPQVPARTPLVPSLPARTPVVSRVPEAARTSAPAGVSGGSLSLAATIEKLEAELADAKAKEEYEKCPPLRDQIKKLKEQMTAPAALDENAFRNAMTKINDDLAKAVEAEEYEKCVPLRNAKKKLEELRSQYDSASPADKAARLRALTEGMQ